MAHARCGQFFLVLHHALVVPSIMVPVVVSLFEATSSHLKYTIVGASAATALSLALKLELRAHVHTRTAREYPLLALGAEHQDAQGKITQLMREAPLLPCSAGLGYLTLSVSDPGLQGEAGESRV